MNPTKTAYMVYYRDTSGSGYQWSEQALTRELGQNVVEAGAAVERRVLAIPADRSYITVEPWCILILVKKAKGGSQVW